MSLEFNAVSQIQSHWICWDETYKNKGGKWIRPRPKDSVNINNYLDYGWDWFEPGEQFETFIIKFAKWYEKEHGDKVACSIGIRCNESLRRFHTIVASGKPNYKSENWTTKIIDGHEIYNCYPMYDWETYAHTLSYSQTKADDERINFILEKYGQDVDKMAINDCYRIWPNGHFEVGDTPSNPAFKGRKFKTILANPPFNIKWDQPTPIEATQDERWCDLPVLPPKSKADWAFIAHCLNYLADDGTMVLLESPGILYRGASESKVRDYFIRQNVIDRIESIPPNTFVDTAIATVLVVFKKNRKPDDPITGIGGITQTAKCTRVGSVSQAAGQHHHQANR